MTNPNPCGHYHPLPCGLDVACPVPSRYYDAELSDEQINDRWLNQ